MTFTVMKRIENIYQSSVLYPAAVSGVYTLPNEVRTIGAYAFAHANISEINLSNVVSINGFAFEYSALEKTVIPNTTKELGNGVFANCAYLSDITIGSSLSSLPDNAFLNTFALKEIIISNRSH